MKTARMNAKIQRKKAELRRLKKRLLLSLALTVVLVVCLSVTAYAASVTVDLGSGDTPLQSARINSTSPSVESTGY